ncbi:MAG TPA: protein kinase [Pyrinomonadaceae bacterium]|nr:protein kinase [Pyrinomonadaceae bacterium]
MPLERGTRLGGRYEIRTLVGSGGMGEVYRAWDTELERVVALKVLPPQIAGDGDRLSRFLQEARAASKLGGAHAAHIYEIKESDGAHFIAMEYVEGQSLDKYIAGKPLDISEIARLGIQIAEALEEAHSKGITHRDIKPANIIITPRGAVKVLDFGLAKINRPEEGYAEDERTASHVKTDPGMVMGTVSYMSPEQALAERDIDHRTDIFSLGVVLYEMATGRVPFAGETTGRTIDNIIHIQPEAMARFNYEVPVELDVIVRKCLRKNRDERYQNVRDLLNDLRSLKADLEFAERERSVPPDLRRSGMLSGLAPRGHSSDQHVTQHTTAGASSEQPTVLFTRDQASGARQEAHTVAAAHRTTAYGGEPSTAEARRGGWPALAFLGVTLGVLLIGAGGFAAYRFATRGAGGDSAQQSAATQAMKITRLTNTGKASSAVISPDGQFVVHVVADGGRQSLWLRQTSAASDREIVPAAEVDYLGVTFTRDGSFVYYVTSERNTQFGVLYKVPTIGGREPQELLRDIDSAVAFSPDGASIAFVRNFPNRNESALIAARADGTQERQLTVFQQPHFIWGAPAWSPDGQRIACAVSAEAGGLQFDLMTVSASDGSRESIPGARFSDVRRMDWLADGSALVISATDQANSPFQVYQVAVADGAQRRVTNDLNRYVGVSLTSDSKSLVTVQVDRRANIWVAPVGADAAARARQITSGVAVEGIGGLGWTPDGRIVYSSQASGNWDIWVMDADGQNQRQLTRDSDQNLHPSVSPDGGTIVFESYRGGGSHVWRMNMDGSDQRPLTNGSAEFTPQFTADGRSVVYQALGGGKWNLWRVPVEGGEPQPVAENVLTEPALSPDGKYFAYPYWDEQAQTTRTAVVSFADGQRVKTFDALPLSLEWSPDSRSLCYIDTRGGVSNVWAQPLAGGQPRRLTDFRSDELFAFAFSTDGRQLALARGHVTRDVVLIKDFR